MGECSKAIRHWCSEAEICDSAARSCVTSRAVTRTARGATTSNPSQTSEPSTSLAAASTHSGPRTDGSHSVVRALPVVMVSDSRCRTAAR